jgi:hypothetical protein
MKWLRPRPTVRSANSESSFLVLAAVTALSIGLFADEAQRQDHPEPPRRRPERRIFPTEGDKSMPLTPALAQRHEERRRFLLAARRYGFTAAVLGLTGGYLTSTAARWRRPLPTRRRSRRPPR